MAEVAIFIVILLGKMWMMGYIWCTEVRPMTNYIDVTFSYDTTTKGPYRITEGQSTPTITDIGDQDVIINICGVDDTPANNYDVTVRIYAGRD